MNVPQLEAENQQLRDELDALKTQELERLREELSAAKHAADHFRQEANRISSEGIALVAEREREIAVLKAENKALTTPPERTR